MLVAYHHGKFLQWKHRETFTLEPSSEIDRHATIVLTDIQGTAVDETTVESVPMARMIFQPISDEGEMNPSYSNPRTMDGLK